MSLHTFVLFTSVSLCCFFTNSYGHYTCREIFSSAAVETTEEPSAPKTSLFGSRNKPVYSGPRSSTEASKNSVYRNPELLKDLIHNRKYGLIRSTSKQGEIVRWFLSLSNNGRLYRVVIRQNSTGKTLDMYAEKPLEKIEKVYYHQIGRNLELEGLHTEIKLPRKGKRELVIEPAVIVKLEVKHEITVTDLIQALRKIPPKIEYRPNKAAHLQGTDSFLFFLDVGARTPLEVVMVHDNNIYTLLTAFFPDFYRH